MTKTFNTQAETNEASLEKKLGYAFTNRHYLRLALTHRSLGMPCNERLEFLGDAILSHVVSAHLYTKYPDMDEGELSCIRSSLVSKVTLIHCAAKIDLLPHVLVGQAERKGQSVRSRNSTMANTLEAVIGAIYLDGGLEPCRDMVLGFYGEKLKNLTCSQSFKDAKSVLQELAQARYKDVPIYQLIDTNGKPHERTFIVCCSVPQCDEKFVGEGPSRKSADKMAALLALRHLVPD